MARKKRRPSKWLLLFFLVLIVAGSAEDQWQPILAGCSGIVAMVSFWVLFKNVVICDVNRRSGSGFCTRRIKGAFFGCGDHHWEKVAAWSRYLGTGYVARKMHIDLPILRWQAHNISVPQAGLLLGHSEARPGKATAEMRQPVPDPRVEVEETYTPSITVQATNFYITFLSGIATVAGLGLSIAQIVK
jgi:hypothetical protein